MKKLKVRVAPWTHSHLKTAAKISGLSVSEEASFRLKNSIRTEDGTENRLDWEKAFMVRLSKLDQTISELTEIKKQVAVMVDFMGKELMRQTEQKYGFAVAAEERKKNQD